MAAKTAAERKKRALLIGKGIGTLSLFSNTIDVLGQLPATMGMVEGLSRWVEDHPEHPYAKLGPDKIQEALSSFLSLFPSPYSFHPVGDGNCLIPTGAGTFRSTRYIPRTMEAGVTLRKGGALIIGFKGFKDFYAGMMADRFECRRRILSLPEFSNREITATALARWMERESFRNRIAHEIKKELQGETRVGFPAVLGVKDPFQVKKGLEQIIGVEVFEIPTLPPSILGDENILPFQGMADRKRRHRSSGIFCFRGRHQGKEVRGGSGPPSSGHHFLLGGSVSPCHRAIRRRRPDSQPGKYFGTPLSPSCSTTRIAKRLVRKFLFRNPSPCLSFLRHSS